MNDGPRELSGLVAMDLTDALACLIIRRDPSNPRGVLVDYGQAPDLSHAQAAHILRQLADRYERRG